MANEEYAFIQPLVAQCGPRRHSLTQSIVNIAKLRSQISALVKAGDDRKPYPLLPTSPLPVLSSVANNFSICRGSVSKPKETAKRNYHRNCVKLPDCKTKKSSKPLPQQSFFPNCKAVPRNNNGACTISPIKSEFEFIPNVACAVSPAKAEIAMSPTNAEFTRKDENGKLKSETRPLQMLAEFEFTPKGNKTDTKPLEVLETRDVQPSSPVIRQKTHCLNRNDWFAEIENDIANFMARKSQKTEVVKSLAQLEDEINQLINYA